MKNSKSKTTPTTIQTLTPEQFVVAWQEAESPAQLASELGWKRTAVCSRATLYRKRGVPLKRFNRGAGKRLNIAALTELANKHQS